MNRFGTAGYVDTVEQVKEKLLECDNDPDRSGERGRKISEPSDEWLSRTDVSSELILRRLILRALPKI